MNDNRNHLALIFHIFSIISPEYIIADEKEENGERNNTSSI